MKKRLVLLACLFAFPLGARAASEGDSNDVLLERLAEQASNVKIGTRVAIESVEKRLGRSATCLYVGSLFKDVMLLTRMLHLKSEIDPEVGQLVAQLYVQSQVIQGFCGIPGGDTASGGGLVLEWLKKGDQRTLTYQLGWMWSRADALINLFEKAGDRS